MELRDDFDQATDSADLNKLMAPIDTLESESRIGVVRMLLLESRIQDQPLVDALHNMVSRCIEVKAHKRNDKGEWDDGDQLSSLMRAVDKRVRELLPSLQ